MKHISKEEFFKQLNFCEYGRQYLELVNNPENHLGKKDKGEVHHIHPRKLGGDLKAEENLVKLTTYNHCLAHVLLAKAGMQLHSNWIGEVLMMVTRMSQGQQFHSLSDLEKITLEDIYNWSELVKKGHKEQGKKTHEKFLDDNYRESFKNKMNDPELKNKLKKIHKETNFGVGENNSRYGTCSIMKDNIYIIIKKEELEYYKSLGWIKKGKPIGKFSEEHKNKIKLAAKNRPPCSDELREKRRKNSLGENNPMYGKHHSEESRKKMKDNYVYHTYERTDEQRKILSEKSKGNKAFLGHKHSPETLEKMRISAKNRKPRKWYLDKETNKRIYYYE